MNAGRIEQIGSPLELYDRPINTFVATFIGSPSMNILAAKASGDSLIVCDLALLGTKIELPNGQGVSFGIRPEDIQISDNSGGRGVAAVLVISVEPTGAETHITTLLGQTEISIVTKDRIKATPGQSIHIDLNSTRSHVFNVETGRRYDFS